MAEREFRVLFCERYGCPLSEYEERAFRKCLFIHARLLAPFLRKLSADFFAADFEAIRYIGQATTSKDLNAELADFQDVNRQKRSFFRTKLQFRVSGRKLAKLAKLVYSSAHSHRTHDRGR